MHFIDGPENFHPYECGGPGKCKHCDRTETEHHKPADCALCHETAPPHDPAGCSVCQWMESGTGQAQSARDKAEFDAHPKLLEV